MTRKKSISEIAAKLKWKAPPNRSTAVSPPLGRPPENDEERWTELVANLHSAEPNEDACRQLLIELGRPPELTVLFRTLIEERRELLETIDAAEGMQQKVEVLRKQVQSVHRFRPASIDDAVKQGEQVEQLERELRQVESLLSQADYATCWAGCIFCFAAPLFGEPEVTHVPNSRGFPTKSHNAIAALGLDPYAANDWKKYRAASATPRRQQYRFA